ncbi:hypothetical protein HZU38_05305 [Mycolicibacterium vanbaalenii]|uniref:hypothetical protein n=1 Tax=Mycolicibacterium vanbaalenii TaxID=110539 RepID=UPI001F2D1479|nr:hypothetical protein [Mycolicibacterium vanbaalenii]UJL29919.1 hypothetical protein HZU38_05305 [Mycolicibacterium vanbaalenii]WND57020.1 hypothetical protein QQA43_00960 [Mycolicibacterium vanbaalenii]
MISSADVDQLLDRWAEDLNAREPWRAAEAIDRLAEAFENEDTTYQVTITDAFWNPVGTANDFIELTGQVPRNAAPTAQLKLPEGHPANDHLANCRNTMVGVIIETEGVSEAFYVKHHTEELGEDGAWTYTSELVGIYDILNYLPIWPSWYLPIQAQPFSHAVFAGPICTVIEAAAAQSSLRIQGGVNEFLNNALSLNPDLRTYFGTLLQRIKNNTAGAAATEHPLYIVRTGLLKDSSPLFVKTVRMTTVGQMVTEITPAYGVDVRVYLWRPGMPQPDGYATLDRPTYVMVVKDRSQIQGPFKNVLDSALRLVVDTQGSLLGRTLDPLLNPNGEYAPEGLHIAPSLGVNFVPPYAVLITPDKIVADGEVVRERSPLISCKIKHSTPLGWQHIIGGKSPKVCAPRPNSRGAQTFGVIKVAQRFDQCVAVVRDRRRDDHHRIHRRAEQPARRLPQRCVLRVPTHPALSATQRRRAVSPGDRGCDADEFVTVQPRGPVPVHTGAPSVQGLHDRDRDVPRPERPLQALPRHLPWCAGDAGLRLAHKAVHRSHRARQVPCQPHET